MHMHLAHALCAALWHLAARHAASELPAGLIATLIWCRKLSIAFAKQATVLEPHFKADAPSCT